MPFAAGLRRAEARTTSAGCRFPAGCRPDPSLRHRRSPSRGSPGRSARSAAGDSLTGKPSGSRARAAAPPWSLPPRACAPRRSSRRRRQPKRPKKGAGLCLGCRVAVPSRVGQPHQTGDDIGRNQLPRLPGQAPNVGHSGVDRGLRAPCDQHFVVFAAILRHAGHHTAYYRQHPRAGVEGQWFSGVELLGRSKPGHTRRRLDGAGHPEGNPLRLLQGPGRTWAGS